MNIQEFIAMRDELKAAGYTHSYSGYMSQWASPNGEIVASELKGRKAAELAHIHMTDAAIEAETAQEPPVLKLGDTIKVLADDIRKDEIGTVVEVTRNGAHVNIEGYMGRHFLRADLELIETPQTPELEKPARFVVEKNRFGGWYVVDTVSDYTKHQPKRFETEAEAIEHAAYKNPPVRKAPLANAIEAETAQAGSATLVAPFPRYVVGQHVIAGNHDGVITAIRQQQNDNYYTFENSFPSNAWFQECELEAYAPVAIPDVLKQNRETIERLEADNRSLRVQLDTLKIQRQEVESAKVRNLQASLDGANQYAEEITKELEKAQALAKAFDSELGRTQGDLLAAQNIIVQAGEGFSALKAREKLVAQAVGELELVASKLENDGVIPMFSLSARLSEIWGWLGGAEAQAAPVADAPFIETQILPSESIGDCEMCGGDGWLLEPVEGYRAKRIRCKYCDGTGNEPDFDEIYRQQIERDNEEQS